MDGWQAIKQVRVEMCEATAMAKIGQKSIAKHCMRHAKVVLDRYLKDERRPEHGFEGRNRTS